jgi:hypothetical protein
MILAGAWHVSCQGGLPFLGMRVMVSVMTIQAVQRLPRNEKLKLMEALWEDLSRSDRDLDSPAWHADELAATEGRLGRGQEQALEWESAKKALRRRFK